MPIVQTPQHGSDPPAAHRNLAELCLIWHYTAEDGVAVAARTDRHPRVQGLQRSVMTRAQFLWGLSSGILVLGIAGAFWWGIGLGVFAATRGHQRALPFIAGVQIAGVVVFTYLALRLRRESGFRRASLNRRDPETRRMFTGIRLVFVLETALVLAAVGLCVLSNRRDLIWPAIGIAVSLHFAPLAHLFSVPAYYVTAALGTVVSTVAVVAPLGPWRVLWLGMSMCPIMWGTAVYLLAAADGLAARATRASSPEQAIN